MITLLPLEVLAADGNIGGTGGTLGNARSNFYWNPTYCGARITVVTQGGVQLGDSFDWLNSNCYGANTYHFGKHSKLYYRDMGISGAIRSISDIAMDKGGYTYYTKSNMPMIVLVSGSNVAQIRDYFTRNDILAGIAATVGLPFGSFTAQDGTEIKNAIYTQVNGGFQTCCVVIEPICAVHCGGINVTGTATELAYWAQASWGMQEGLNSIYRMQLPLSIYLETPQLGFQANPSAAISWRSREDVISYLGIGIVSFGKNGASLTPELPPLDTPDVTVPVPPSTYEYHTDTEVYTSVRVENTTGSDIQSTPTKIKFTVEGANYPKREFEQEVIIPKDKAVLSYCKWRTPATEGTVTVKVEADSEVTLSCDNVVCNIVGFGITTPPDPRATDRNDSFVYTEPSSSGVGSATWGHWNWTNSITYGNWLEKVWDYNESGWTGYSDWEYDAWEAERI